MIVIDDPALATPLGAALVVGGLPSAEVTLRTDSALESLRALAEIPGVLVGAGTVVRPARSERPWRRAPGTSCRPASAASVSRECPRLGVPVLPGVVTATEILAALEAASTR